MCLSATQRNLIERVIDTVEPGRPAGDCPDGPNDGRAQATEYDLRKRVQGGYVAAGDEYSAALAPYAERIGSEPRTTNSAFKRLLRDAGKHDPTMRRIHDLRRQRFAKNPPSLSVSVRPGSAPPIAGPQQQVPHQGQQETDRNRELEHQQGPDPDETVPRSIPSCRACTHVARGAVPMKRAHGGCPMPPMPHH
ncbi:MAG TPA: hypothetical protein VGD21_15470 [Lysobacter sp.]